MPVWMSRGTWRALAVFERPAGLRFARDGEAIAIGDLELHPFTVAHDAAEPLQLCVSDGAARLGVLTDAGSITPHMLAGIAGCDALVLECNHDAAMLAASRYPPSLKTRIGGRLGHLSNAAAALLLGQSASARLRHVVAAHLSRENNRPAIARQALAEAWGSQAEDVVVADPMTGFDWLRLA